MSPDWEPNCTLELLQQRAAMLSAIRAFFAERRVLEVETPSLCNTVGTDPNLDFFRSRFNLPGGQLQNLIYLQTSPEFSMKRLLAAGSGSIYQICKAFRNGEVGRYHNPEFTILEWYRVGFSLPNLIDEVDVLLRQILGSSLTPRHTDHLSYASVFYRFCGLDPIQADISVFVDCAIRNGLSEAVEICAESRKLWQEFLFSHLVQPNLGVAGLTIVDRYPASQATLARRCPDNPLLVDRFEVFCQGVELANGFQELRDAEEQELRFDQELQQRTQEGKFAPAKDNRFLSALKTGLPECVGVAIGLDRVLMLAAGVDSIEDVLPFSISRA